MFKNISKKNTYSFKNNIENVKINNTLKKTYILLSLTILFSSIMTFLGIITNSKINTFLYIIISFLLLFLLDKNKNNSVGIFLIFLFTGFTGYFLNPLIKNLIYTQNGQNLIILSLVTTSLIFFTLSILTSVIKKKITFLNSFIYTGFITLVLLLIINIFIKITIFQLIISSLIIILSSLIIINTINNIITDNNYNYIDATIELYLSIYNIFISIINLLTVFKDDN